MPITRTLLAHDPGSKNYAYAVVQGSLLPTTIRFQIHQYGLIKTTIHDLTGSAASELHDTYLSTIRLLSKGVGGFVAERFQPRGVSNQTTIECVNLMLGSCFNEFEGKPRMLFTASQWKNALRRNGIDLDAVYADQMKDEKAYRLTNHEIDACLIGVYGLNKMFRGHKNFEGTPNVMEDVLDQMRKGNRINVVST